MSVPPHAVIIGHGHLHIPNLSSYPGSNGSKSRGYHWLPACTASGNFTTSQHRHGSSIKPHGHSSAGKVTFWKISFSDNRSSRWLNRAFK